MRGRFNMFSGNGNNSNNGNSDSEKIANLTLMLLAISCVIASRNFNRHLFSNPPVSREVESSTAVALRGPSPTLFGLATGGVTAVLSMPRHIVENKYNGRQSVGNEIISRNNLTTVTPSQLPDEGYMYRVRFCHTSTSNAIGTIPATLGYVASVQHCAVLVEGFKINPEDGTIIGDKPAIVAVYGYNNCISRDKREIIKNRMVQDLKDLTGMKENNPEFQRILKDQLRCAAGLNLDDNGQLRGMPGTGFMNEACADFLDKKQENPFIARKEDVLNVESMMPLVAVQAGFNETVNHCSTATLNHAHRNCGTAAMFGVHRMYVAAGSLSKNAERQALHEKQKNFAKGVNQGVGVTRNKTIERAASLPSIKFNG